MAIQILNIIMFNNMLNAQEKNPYCEKRNPIINLMEGSRFTIAKSQLML